MPIIRPVRPKRHGPGTAGAPTPVIQSLINGLLNAGKIYFYEGTKPASPTTGAGTNLLASITFDMSDSAPLANLITSTSIAMVIAGGGGRVHQSGTVGWCRTRSVDNLTVVDSTVGLSGADVLVNTTSWVMDQFVAPTVIRGNDISGLVITGTLSVS